MDTILATMLSLAEGVFHVDRDQPPWTPSSNNKAPPKTVGVMERGHIESGEIAIPNAGTCNSCLTVRNIEAAR